MGNQGVRTYLFHAFLCAFILLGGLSVSAQTPSPTPSPIPQTSSNKRLERDFFKNILSDQKAIWTAPFHLHGRNARWLAPLALGTAALITTDRNTAAEVAESRDQLTPSRTISYMALAGSPPRFIWWDEPPTAIEHARRAYLEAKP